jgi:hypothetical protein
MGFLKPHLAQLILANVYDMAGGSVAAQTTFAVDVADAQRPFPVEDVGMAVRDRHHHFVQAHGVTPRSVVLLDG